MKIFNVSLVFYFLFITSAFAGLVGSPHDFTIVFGSADGPCGYCHSVHNSVGGAGSSAVLQSMATVTEVYDNTVHVILNDLTTNTANTSDAPLCLTCHDGTYASSSTNLNLQNIGNRISNPPVPYTDRKWNIGSSLKDDHPVGFVFDDLDATDKIKTPAPGSRVHVTFGLSRNQMWCSSCHNVHNNDNPPFLTTSNVGSALCLECHIK